MKNIYSAFVKAQMAFAPALKTSKNPHFKSQYADLATCVEAVIDALNSNGIALLQPTHEDSTGVTVETLFIHESGEQLSAGKLHVPAAKQDPQGYGSALTYARRYSLMAACGIAPEDDDGNAASRQRPQQVRVITQAQAARLQGILSACPETVVQRFTSDWPDTSTMPADQYDAIASSLQRAAQKYQAKLKEQEDAAA